MRAPLTVFAFVAALVAGAGAQAASATGVWLTKGGKSHVKIERCGDKLCGKIIWLREPNDKDGRPKRDTKNPNATLKSRPILNLKILNGFVRTEGSTNAWEGGRIYNPSNGKTYRCKMSLSNPNTLRVRGYVGISLFGETQIWQRVK